MVYLGELPPTPRSWAAAQTCLRIAFFHCLICRVGRHPAPRLGCRPDLLKDWLRFGYSLQLMPPLRQHLYDLPTS